MNNFKKWMTCLAAPLLAGALRPALAQEQVPGQLSPSFSPAQVSSPRAPLPECPGRPSTLEDRAAERDREDDLADGQIQALKAREPGPPRFAADLFAIPIRKVGATEGGIADDYVLGTGDRINLFVFGGATFELPVQVDGRGEIVIPKVGAVKVGGLALSAARHAVEALVGRTFSRSRVDLQVTRLREIRVFVMGEVYRPGNYRVPSLSSLVNVLGLAGGPTAMGSYRDIRVIRAGRPLHSLDLYPLRAEGLGNVNLTFQSGDILFVPMASSRILLKGAFQRLVLQPPPGPAESRDDPAGEPVALSDAARLALRRASADRDGKPGEPKGLGAAPLQRPAGGEEPPPWTGAGDQGLPGWFERAEGQDESLPTMQFEIRPGETVADAVRWAGGLVAEAFLGNLSLRRVDARGVLKVLDVPAEPGAMAAMGLQKGDVLSALIRRQRLEEVVSVRGWVRVPGTFARGAGLRVGQLLARDQQVLPDTYLARGEIQRTLPDGGSRFLAFDVAEALRGTPGHDLPLADLDKVTLFRKDSLRQQETVTILGPVTRPGAYPFQRGMRVADLLFRAGLPLKRANALTAELARHRSGGSSAIRDLDLARLTSTEDTSPVDLRDDAANPPLEPDDLLSLFEKPGYRVHRVVRVSGEVARPGSYALENSRQGILELVRRAGGVTASAMPAAGILVRQVGDGPRPEPDDQAGGRRNPGASEKAGTRPDPTGMAINEILDRLSETKRDAREGRLLRTPILHGLGSGKLNRLVVDFPAILAGRAEADLELADGDEIIIPRMTDGAFVVGETASPFASYKLSGRTTVKALLSRAGGTTRNADTRNIRLLKADGRILDAWVLGRTVEPGDAVLVPQRILRDTTWQDNLNALTPVGLLLNALRR